MDKVHRPVFGVPLADSLQIAPKANLPAIVYRCIEYLEAKKAETEEGIYRLSGSSAMIKGLKDRFDIEGDVNLVQIDERWDPHAIAGLLKTFLRELPTSLLTMDLHPRFLAVMGGSHVSHGWLISVDLIDSSARVAELSRLVSELPPPNYALLRALTAHLILIVRNSSINKMTLRNIGIVFSPTLGIPAGIFSELVTHFGAIFDDEVESNEEVVNLGSIAESVEEAQDTITRRRNSLLYQAGGADALLGLGGRSLDPGECPCGLRRLLTSLCSHGRLGLRGFYRLGSGLGGTFRPFPRESRDEPDYSASRVIPVSANDSEAKSCVSRCGGRAGHRLVEPGI